MHAFQIPRPDIITASSRIGTGVYAGRDLRSGERFCSITGAVSSQPTRLSMQIEKSLHIEPGDAAWQFSNHACDPNLAVDFSEWCFVALRDIRAGEELNWNYLTTEWRLSDPFECQCGSAGCFGTIAGFSALEPAQRATIADAAPHLTAMGGSQTLASHRQLTTA